MQLDGALRRGLRCVADLGTVCWIGHTSPHQLGNRWGLAVCAVRDVCQLRINNR